MTNESAPPLVDQRQVGRELGVRWGIARQILEAAGVHTIDAGTPRRWFVNREDWLALRKRLRLDRRKRGAA